MATEHSHHRKAIGGFSLIELVIVIVITALLAAIAIPRLSRGATGAADSALVQDLDALRKALDHYAAEHGGVYPDPANIKKQLTKYTDDAGNVSSNQTGAFIYGPYLTSIPSLPVGNGGGQIGAVNSGSGGVGWAYDNTTGSLRANTTTEADATGKLYSSY
jgi:prepilin-type N-terminal cleavage/methylation domain-containing protein